MTETREIGLATFIPDETRLTYDFSLDVLKGLTDGFVQAKYKRPSMTQTSTDPESGEPRSDVEKMNMELDLTLSPINEITDVKDLTPKPKTNQKSGGWTVSDPKLIRHFRPMGVVPPVQGSLLSQFVGEIYRLALFMGSLDSALDFQPKLPFDEVKPGDTWKRTVSYSPQKLEAKGGKSVMQRLDYLYTYRGVVESNKVKVHRVSAELEMSTDLVKYIKDTFGNSDEIVNQLKEITLNLKAHIDYDLDLTSLQTTSAFATSKGGFKVVLIQAPDNPVVEQKISGETSLLPIKSK